MKLLSLLVLVLHLAIAIGIELSRRPLAIFDGGSEARIINGQIASRSQFPHQVAILIQIQTQVFFCSGSLICNSWILTAAHCAQGASNFTVILGAYNITQQNEVGSVSQAATTKFVHPLYNSITLANDIALIRLDTIVTFSSFIQPIALGDTFLPPNFVVTVSGWGRTSDASTSNSPVLRYAEVRTITNLECTSAYGIVILTFPVVCCKGNPNQNTCNGDSGGPLITYQNEKPIQQGIVSFGSSAGCESGIPSAYTRVASHLPWIRSIIGDTCNLV